MLVIFSCEEKVEVRKSENSVESTLNETKKGKSGARTAAACSGSFSGTHSVIASNFTYPSSLLDVSCAASGATVSVSVTALDVPNRFTIRDLNGNFITATGWLGNASYGGPWGSSLSNSGTATLTFSKSFSSYNLIVETITPPNFSYSPSTDYWSATYGCTCTGTPPPTCPSTPCPVGFNCVNGVCICASCPAGFSCVNNTCQCTTTCGGNFQGNFGVLNTYFTYPLRSFSTGCKPNGTVITVSVTALDVPNRFTILDASGNFVVGSNWLGNASYGGPWGPFLSNSGSTTLTFAKTTSTYSLRVETITPPNGTYNPSTDYWSSNISCPQ